MSARSWRDIAPADAVSLDLSKDMTIDAPLNEAGERCPWPWEPQQMTGVPLGQYHCGYCGAMVIAGMTHLDYRPCPRCGAEWGDMPGCTCPPVTEITGGAP